MPKRINFLTRMWFILFALIIATWSIEPNAQTDWVNEPVYRWDMPEYNRLNRNIITEVEDQTGNVWVRPDCHAQSSTNILESKIQIESDMVVDITAIDAIHWFDLTGNGIFEFWESSGIVMDDCAPLNFSPYISESEKCPRLPIYLKDEAEDEYDVKMGLCSFSPTAVEDVTEEIKSYIVNHGPVAFRFEKHSGDCEDFWIKFSDDPKPFDTYVMDKVFSTCDLLDPDGHHWVTIIGWNDYIDVRDLLFDKDDNPSNNPIIGYGAWLIKDSSGEDTPKYNDAGLDDPPEDINPPGYWWYAYPEHHAIACVDPDGEFPYVFQDVAQGNNIHALDINAIQQGLDDDVCIVYVTPEGGGGNQDGTSWGLAIDGDKKYPSQGNIYGLQWAINRADLLSPYPRKCDVWVAKGEYNFKETIYLKEDVYLVGGFSGTETLQDIIDNNSTRDLSIDATILKRDISVDNMRIIESVDGSKIDGFTIRDGYINDGSGGGLYSNGGTIVKNCYFIDNHAGSMGGGMYSHGGGDILYNCTFITNEAYKGGGLAHVNGSIKVGWTKFLTNKGIKYGGGAYNQNANAKYLGA